jgi:iron complex transport system substrate-binding protein
MIKAALGLLLAVLFANGFTEAVAENNKPQRIVSLSLCTDQILLALVEPERIGSVTFLAQDSVYSFQHENANKVAVHHNMAEEIVPQQPDLVIGIVYGNLKAQEMLRRLDFRLETFSSPNSLKEVESFTRSIAKLLGEEEKAEQILKDMHAEINQAKAMVDDLDPKLAISYGPNGFTAGENTMKNEVFELVGFKNLAAELGVAYYGNLSVEQLLAAKPDYIIVDEAMDNQDSLAQQYVNHPVLRQLYPEHKMPKVELKYWLCPGPSISKAVMSLAKQRQAANNG